MDKKTEQRGLKNLRHIEKEVTAIESRTPGSPLRSFFNGIMQGGGAVVGSIAAIALVGWLLGVFGIIPGLGDLAHYFQDIIAKLNRG